MPSNNPRYANFKKRADLRKWLGRQGLPCALCGKPIDYSLTTFIDPKDGKRKPHPLSFEMDEIVPISLGGSPIDPNNVQPTHRMCNQRKGNGKKKKANNSADKTLVWSNNW